MVIKKETHDIPQMPSLENDEEEFADIQPIALLDEKALKILTQNKLLTRLPILLAQIKARNNSHKLNIKIRQILYLLYQHTKITKKLYNLIRPL